MARPKETEKRVAVHMKILPGTLMKIDSQKRKGDRSANSRGKVVDKLASKLK